MQFGFRPIRFISMAVEIAEERQDHVQLSRSPLEELAYEARMRPDKEQIIYNALGLYHVQATPGEPEEVLS